jgi:hypothetical protein
LRERLSVSLYHSNRLTAPAPPGLVPLVAVAARVGLTEAALRQRARRGKLPLVRRDGRCYLDEQTANELISAYDALRTVARRAQAAVDTTTTTATAAADGATTGGGEVAP